MWNTHPRRTVETKKKKKKNNNRKVFYGNALIPLSLLGAIDAEHKNTSIANRKPETLPLLFSINPETNKTQKKTERKY